MAEEVSIGVGRTAKVRNPLGIALLTLATAIVGLVALFGVLVLTFDEPSGSGLLGFGFQFSAVGVLWESTVLFGIYGFFWLYFVLGELRDVAIARSDERLFMARIRPGLVVALTILFAWTVIVPIVVLVFLMVWVRHAQQLAGVERTSLPLLIALLVGTPLFYLPVFAFYGVIQDGLNRIWRSYEAVAPQVALPEAAPAS